MARDRMVQVNTPHPIHQGLFWQCRDRRLPCDDDVRVMGILNVTPDSFSDGGAYPDAGEAADRALRMLDEGADIIDIGGESSRPGSAPVPVEEELRRVLPVIERIAPHARGLLSIDTTKAAVARAALDRGVHIINDISALTADPAMSGVAAATGAGVCLMHMQGKPKDMQVDPHYEDVVREVRAYLHDHMEALAAQGVAREAMVIDPGIGFGKTVDHNLSLLAGLTDLCALGRPVLVGASRKSFLGTLTGLDVGERLAPSLAAAAFAIRQGARILRVHDVKETCALVRLLAILEKKARNVVSN